MCYKILPSRRQFKKYSLPSKWTIIGGIVGIIALVITIFAIVNPNSVNENEIKDSLKNEIESVRKVVKDEATINRIKSLPISYMTVWLKPYTINPEDVSLLVLCNNSQEFRIDFTTKEIFLDIENHRGLRTPLTPSAVKSYAQWNFYGYQIDLKHLQKVEPQNPLSNLTLEKLDNAPIRVLINNNTREKLLQSQKKEHFRIWMSAQLSGYDAVLFEGVLDSRDNDLNFFLPREIIQKPGFVMLISPVWNIQFSKIEKSIFDFAHIEQSVDYAELRKTKEYWRGIWPNEGTKEIMRKLCEFPLEEDRIVFHPWNYHFVRIKRDLEKSFNCSVDGIAAFQIYSPYAKLPTFRVFLRITSSQNQDKEYTLTFENKTLELSINEIGTILNCLRQVAVLNQTWVQIEGDELEALCTFITNRKKYIMLSPQKYYEYSLKNPYDKDKDYIEQAIGFFSNSLAGVMTYPE